MKPQGPTYAVPFDRARLDRGAFLVMLRGASAKNSDRNRQRIFDQLMEQFEAGLAPFDDQDCFSNGLSEQDLIYIPSPPELEMSKNVEMGKQPSAPKSTKQSAPAEPQAASPIADSQAKQQAEQQADILLAATEILELAKLKVALAQAYRDAQQYKELVFKVIDTEGGHLSEEECEVVSHKNFAKTIKGLAEARVKVSSWAETSSGNHGLILNELSFVEEEIVTALATAKSKTGKGAKETAQETAQDDGEEKAA